MNNLKFKTFSFKKLLLTILCTAIVSVFIGTTILFIFSIPNWLQTEVVASMEKDSEALIEMVKSYQENLEQIQEIFNEDKALYGEDYPTEGIFLFQLINTFSRNRIVEVYTMSVLIGIALGTIIYIIAVQNINGKQMLIELVVAFIVLFVLITLLNIGYEAIINKAISNANATDVKYSTYIYDLESNNILIPYIIVAIIIYLANMIRQKIITNKLNKQLNNK